MARIRHLLNKIHKFCRRGARLPEAALTGPAVTLRCERQGQVSSVWGLPEREGFTRPVLP